MKKGFTGVAVAFLAWALLSIVWVSPFLVTATPYRVDRDPSSRGLLFETIRIPSEDLLLEGWWIPAESPRAELIFVHGAGSNRISQFVGSLDFYRTLHDMGVSVITMDLRNHGNSDVADGMLGMGAKEWPDVSAAAIWLDQHQPSELPRIALGASMGGNTLIHAINNGLSIDAAILLDPQLDVLDSLKQAARVTTGLPAPLFEVAARSAIARYQLPHGGRGPLALAAQISLPTLLIQDWDDPVTRSDYAARLAAENPSVTLKKVPPIPPDSHCLDGKQRWGSHVAAHPCHPEWTRKTLAAFFETALFGE